MLTAAQARELFANVPPERWTAAVQTLVVDALETCEKLQAKLDRVALGAFVTAKEVKALREGGVAEAPAEDTPTAAPAPEPAVPAASPPTVGADGEPLSAEQAAIEAQMNEAIAGQQIEKQRATAPAPAGATGNGRKRPALVPPPKGAKPAAMRPTLTPEQNAEQRQADIEAQMDAAAGPRPQ